jgi:hypothetical protein
MDCGHTHENCGDLGGQRRKRLTEMSKTSG